MPANLTPEYKTAETAYRKARDPRERLDLLKEMLRVIPKHKGTDHLQADIKTKIKELTEELAGPRKTGSSTAPPTVIRPEGAAQVALVGPPNTGKSSLHDRLTGSHAATGPYPFTTQYPQPGMLPVEDVGIQLVDLPPLSPQHPVPWIGNALQVADGVIFVVDLSQPGCVEQALAAVEILRERKVVLVRDWDDPAAAASEDDPFTVHLPTVLLASRCDLVDDLDGELEVFVELSGFGFPVLRASVETGEGLGDIGPWLFSRLGIVRVYTKIPGRPPDMTRPFTVRHGATVHDVALLVHRDIAGTLRFARLWGGGEFDAQQVGRDHVVTDGDVLELHGAA